MFTLYVNHSSSFPGRTKTTTRAAAGAATGCGCAVGGQRYATAEGAVKAFCVNAINVEINSTTDACSTTYPQPQQLHPYSHHFAPPAQQDLLLALLMSYVNWGRRGMAVAIVPLRSPTFTYSLASTAGGRHEACHAASEGCHQKVSIAKQRRNYEIFY